MPQSSIDLMTGRMDSPSSLRAYHSGRNGDKIEKSGLTPVFADGTIYFAEADMVFICRRLYQSTLLERGFSDKELIDFNYPERDFHEMYVGEILKVLVKDNR